jgi:hypothetical protein
VKTSVDDGNINSEISIIRCNKNENYCLVGYHDTEVCRINTGVSKENAVFCLQGRRRIEVV